MAAATQLGSTPGTGKPSPAPRRQECQGTGAVGASPHRVEKWGGASARRPLLLDGSSRGTLCMQPLCLWKVCVESQPHAQSLYRLVVRMSRPGWTPGGHGILVCRGLKGIESGSSLLSSFLFLLPLALSFVSRDLSRFCFFFLDQHLP